MPDPSDRTGDRLADLVFAWQREWDERGRDVPAGELCRDCPELAAELDRRIQAVRRMNSLVAPAANAQSETIDLPPAAKTRDLPNSLPARPGYEFLEKASEGAMGVVYKALRVRLNRLEAVKVIRGGAVGPRDLARFRLEAEAAAGLDHPNIVSVYDFGEVDGQPYLAMQWVEGRNLADWLRDGPFAPDPAARLVAKLARAVDHAHRRAVLHRDLKPANVLLDAAGEPYVTDFGVARRLDNPQTLTEPGALVGTVAYMAPEQARAERHLTTAVDVHALGAILYELLTGRPPFGRGDLPTLLRRVTEDPAPPVRSIRPEVPADLEAVCLKCLEKEPARRYGSPQDLADDLDRFLAADPVLARPRTLIEYVVEAFTRPTRPQTFMTLDMAFFACVHHPAVHGLIAALSLAGAPTGWAAGVMVYQLAAWAAQIWWFGARRWAELGANERPLLALHVGLWLAVVTLLPIHLAFFGLDPVPLYPLLNAVMALGAFAAAPSQSGRHYLAGLLVFAQNLFLPVLPTWVWPALHGLTGGAAFALIGFHLRRVDRETRQRMAEPASFT